VKLSRKYEYLDCAPIDELNWKVTGNFPTIRIPKDCLPSGWVNLEFEYLANSGEHRDPVFLFETHGIKGRIRLNKKQDRYISHAFKLSKDVSDISIDLVGAKGSFLLSEPVFTSLSGFSAMRLIVLGILNQKSNRSWRSIRNMCSLGIGYLRNKGVKAFIYRLSEVYRQGLSKEIFIGKSLSAYQDFQKDWDLTSKDYQVMEEKIKTFSNLPLVSIVMPVFDPEEKWLSQAIDSVLEQSYTNWELCIADDASTNHRIRKVIEEYCLLDSRVRMIERSQNGHISAASNSALDLAQGEWIALVDHDDVLHPAALFCVVDALQNNPNLHFIYTDEDKIGSDGERYQPYFKPDYNPSLLTSQNYFNHLSVVKRTLVEELGGFRLGYEGAQDYDLFLRCVRRVESNEIFHIPFPLYSWRANRHSTAATSKAKDYAEEAGIRALDDHFSYSEERVIVSKGLTSNTYRSRYELPDEAPLVSIIIPTRDGEEYLSRCLSSLHKLTGYSNFEVVVLDNGSSKSLTLDVLKEFQENGLIRVVECPEPFNYSALNNKGVEVSAGDLVCLLNDDIEVIDGEWLEEMVTQLLREKVGVVGAKLLFPDKSVQHAGIVTGIGGIAGHGHKYATSIEDGYFSRLKVVHDVGAVTGACLLTTRKLWKEIGGLDEQSLKVAFNDVDYCLKIQALGHRIVWSPYAKLVHHESKTRGLDITEEKMKRLQEETEVMKKRWGEVLLHDPAYNPNLSLDTEKFDVAERSRFVPPWRSSNFG